MSENVQKLIGIAVMALIVVVGVVVTNDDDSAFTRNRSFRDNPAALAGADRVAEKDVDSQILTSLGTLEYRTNNIEIALADLEDLIEAMAADLEVLSQVSSAGSPSIEAFADMITNLCVGDLRTAPVITVNLKDYLWNQDGQAYYLSDFSILDRETIQKVVRQRFNKCATGWLLGMNPLMAKEVAVHFGWSGSIDQTSYWHGCGLSQRRPRWNSLSDEFSAFSYGHGYYVRLTTEKDGAGNDIVTDVSSQLAPGAC